MHYFVFFFFFKIYLLFIFDCVGSYLWHTDPFLRHAGSFIAACGLFIVVCGLLSSCGSSLAVVHRLQDAWAL